MNQPNHGKPDNQQIEQQIIIFKRQLFIPKKRNSEAGGSMGRAIEVKVNLLTLYLDKLFQKMLYQIDVQFTPELPQKLLRIALEKFIDKHYPKVYFAFDGKRTMYTTKKIKWKTDLISVLSDENNRPIECVISIMVVKTIQMNTIQMNTFEDYLKSGSSITCPSKVIRALDIVLKNLPCSLRFTDIGKSFFPFPRTIPTDLGKGMELWKRFYQSMGLNPHLNLNGTILVEHNGYYQDQPLINYIANELHCDLNSEMDFKSLVILSSCIDRLQVSYMIPNLPYTKRSYTVFGLLNNASKLKINMKNPECNKPINIVEYFRSVQNYIIKHPNLPCLHVGYNSKPYMKIAIPIELCTVTSSLKILTKAPTAAILKNGISPTEQGQTIENVTMDIRCKRYPVQGESGFDVRESLAAISARIMDQLYIAYAHNKETISKSGVWEAEQLSNGVTIKKWVILNLDKYTNIAAIKKFEKNLMNNDLNVDIQPMEPVIGYFLPKNINLNKLNNTLRCIFKTQKYRNIELIVVIIPNFEGIYAAVKQISELEIGVLTQCVKSKTMNQINKQTLNNILIKINTKLNGFNQTLANRSRPQSMEDAIIFGACLRLFNKQSTTLSIASVVASHDCYGSQYNMEFSLQSSEVKIIEELETIVHKQLLNYIEKTGKAMPKKIFYFRDDIIQTQFVHLLRYEIIAIQKACLRIDFNYKPTLTVLVVQRGRRAKMCPNLKIDMNCKLANIPSDTALNTHITHPTQLQFYLCSHASTATCRPTKYRILCDGNNFTEAELKQLIFYLCFTSVHGTQPLPHPAPTTYAHFAALRAKAYVQNQNIDFSTVNAEEIKTKPNQSFTDNTPMFFV